MLVGVVSLAVAVASINGTAISWLAFPRLIRGLSCISAAEECPELLVVALRLDEDEVAPVDGPNPTQDHDGCEDLKEAHDELSFVCSVSVADTSSEDGACAGQNNVEY